MKAVCRVTAGALFQVVLLVSMSAWASDDKDRPWVPASTPSQSVTGRGGFYWGFGAVLGSSLHTRSSEDSGWEYEGCLDEGVDASLLYGVGLRLMKENEHFRFGGEIGFNFGKGYMAYLEGSASYLQWRSDQTPYYGIGLRLAYTQFHDEHRNIEYSHIHTMFLALTPHIGWLWGRVHDYRIFVELGAQVPLYSLEEEHAECRTNVGEEWETLSYIDLDHYMAQLFIAVGALW